MIEVTQAFQDAWLNGNQKYIQLDFSDSSSLDDDSIVSESFTMRQALSEESQLAFGLTSSTEVSIQILNSGKQYKGLNMSILVGAVDDENHYYTMSLGTYKIEDDVRSDDRLYRTLTAYDALYGVLNEDYSAWYNTLNDTFTLKQFRDAFFTHIGITQETFTLAQDSVTLNKKPNVTSLSGKDILQGICETSASFGFLNYTGKFQYVTPTIGSRHFPSNDIYPSDTFYPGDGADIVIDGSSDEGAPVMGGLVYSDYYTHKITGASFVYSENTPAAQSGTTANVYQFSDSILFYGQTTSALQGIASNFLTMASSFFYIPSQIKCRARIWAQLGDLLLVQAGSNSVLMPILEREMTGITALYDTYEAKGTEYYVYSANSLTARMTENEARTSENAGAIEDANDAIDVLDSEINDPTTGVKASIQNLGSELSLEVTRRTNGDTDLSSRITVTENGITSEVTNRTNADNSLSSRIDQSAHTISMSVSGTASKSSAAGITITLKDKNGNTLNSGSGYVYIDGNVIFSSQLTDGTTTISGDNIKTGMISANRIDTSSLNLSTTSGSKTTSLSGGEIQFSYSGRSAGSIYGQGLGNLQFDCSYGYFTGGLYSNGNTVVTSGNIGSYSVGYADYADDAGGVAWGDVYSKPTIFGSSISHVSESSSYIVSSLHTDSTSNGVTSLEVRRRTSSSDIRLKTNIIDIDNSIDKVYMSLRPVGYNFDPTLDSVLGAKHHHYGLLAQQVLSAFEENDVPFVNEHLVTLNRVEDGSDDIRRVVGDDTFYNVQYEELHAWHIHMIQKQQRKIEELEQRIAVLEGGN